MIRRGGLEQASVRNIAQEAGLSVGSMRHYFASQAELFAYCMNLFVDRIHARFQTMKFDGSVLTVLKMLILQFLPVDEDRRLEMEVWLSFSAKAVHDPELKKLSDKMYDDMHGVSRFVIDTLVKEGLAKPDLQADIEQEKLYALIDGLAVHHLLRPDALPAERLEAIIDEHLRSLCVPEAGNGQNGR
ncbi:TetR/AcrR family transcriptional regulator [Paenibacillus thermoaerophilus]